MNEKSSRAGSTAEIAQKMVMRYGGSTKPRKARIEPLQVQRSRERRVTAARSLSAAPGGALLTASGAATLKRAARRCR
jgi:hypothetical protein